MSVSVEPGAEVAAERDDAALIDVDHLRVLFPIKSGLIIDRTIGNVHAVDDVSFELREGETIGVVGESGSGKTTLIRALARLAPITSGTIKFRGQDITSAGRSQLQPIRREMQMVFQDPQASLNPRKRVGQILATPLRLRRGPRKPVDRLRLLVGPILAPLLRRLLRLRSAEQDQVEAESRRLLERVGLSPEHINRFPHEFSGGQRQRIGIARALAVNPLLILLDEPVSALDVSIQAQVINLLEDLQNEFNLSYIFVAHDLSVVRHVSDRILVMYLGKLMEVSRGETLYSKPIHPYTSALLDAIPIPDPEENRARSRPVLAGEPPSPIRPPSGCRFHTRCPRATDICQKVEPPLADYGSGHLAACHHPQNVSPDEVAAAVRSDASPVSAGQEMPEAGGDGSPSKAPPLPE